MEGGITDVAKEFIGLGAGSVIFLIVLGFLGGLISGFIGSGGAFVLTPGMMSLGVPATIAVATNMCHKFPKALVGAYKRNKFGQVDIKLGVLMGLIATAGVQVGIQVQKWILNAWGEAGSNLYVSLAFVSILSVIGLFMLVDSRKARKSETGEKISGLARKMQSINLPPMIKLKNGGSISVWIIIPIALGTGLLAATISVGGFVGVPGMIYILGMSSLLASGSELIIAFMMGLAGTVTWGLGGFVDIRMVLLILAGSLFGVQVGAIGTTYVKDYMVKLVMALVMLVVCVSRALVLPNYLNDLGMITVSAGTMSLLKNTSFVVMCLALAIGGAIILGNMWLRRRALARVPLEEAKARLLPLKMEESKDQL